MSSDETGLGGQLHVLKAEGARLRDLLAVNADWRELERVRKSLENASLAIPEAVTLKARVAVLEAALARNRIYNAYNRLCEAVALIEDEQRDPLAPPHPIDPAAAIASGATAGVAVDGSVPAPAPEPNREPARTPEPPANTGPQPEPSDLLPLSPRVSWLRGDREAFRTRVKVKIHTAPPGHHPGANERSRNTDDLTRIRGLDRQTAARLNGLGVMSWDQIAAWKRDDVLALSAALGLDRRIYSEGWIEQAAALLAKAGRSLPPHPSGLHLSESHLGRTPEHSHREQEALIAAQIEALVRQASFDIWARSREQYAAAKLDASPQSSAAGSGSGGQTPAAPVPEALSTTSDAALEAFTTVQPLTPDDLCAIRGLDGEAAERLSRVGIDRFEQIAAWTVNEVAEYSIAMRLGSRITNGCWIEQAALLATGRKSRFALARATRTLPPLPVAEALFARALSPNQACAARLRKLCGEPAAVVEAGVPGEAGQALQNESQALIQPPGAPAASPPAASPPAASPPAASKEASDDAGWSADDAGHCEPAAHSDPDAPAQPATVATPMPVWRPQPLSIPAAVVSKAGAHPAPVPNRIEPVHIEPDRPEPPQPAAASGQDGDGEGIAAPWIREPESARQARAETSPEPEPYPEPGPRLEQASFEHEAAAAPQRWSDDDLEEQADVVIRRRGDQPLAVEFPEDHDDGGLAPELGIAFEADVEIRPRGATALAAPAIDPRPEANMTPAGPAARQSVAEAVARPMAERMHTSRTILPGQFEEEADVEIVSRLSGDAAVPRPRDHNHGRLPEGPDFRRFFKDLGRR